MQPIWIIEAGVFGQNAERLRADVERQGMECYAVTQHTLADDLTLLRGEPLTAADCVICYSSFPFAHFVQEKRHWVPGSWCDFDNLACSTYYAHFGPYLLNQDCAILSGVTAIRQRDALFDRFGRDGQVFVRPDSVEKLLTGQCVNREEWETALAPTRYSPDTLVVVAAPHTIGREWRLVVAQDRVIAASQYMENGRKVVVPDCPNAVRDFVHNILADVRWRPDKLFMVDVCETKNDSKEELFVLELNSFSCSGLYACDLAAVVESASSLARHEFEIATVSYA